MSIFHEHTNISFNKQSSVINPSSCYGIGLHSGKKTQLTIKPAKANTGIVFIRTDIKNIDNVIYASYQNVFSEGMCSNIKNPSGACVYTIEHIMAALWGSAVDNAIIEIDGPEVPMMDGSSKAFLFMIECAGKKLQDAPKKYCKILKEIEVSDGVRSIVISPSESFIEEGGVHGVNNPIVSSSQNSLKIDFKIDFKSKAIGSQTMVFSDVNNSFSEDIAPARTFGFVSELEYLKNKGLALGASLENAIGIDVDDKILNEEGLRYENEFVRHKILDMIGDLYTASVSNIFCNIVAQKSGHQINNELLHKLYSNPNNYSFVRSDSISC